MKSRQTFFISLELIFGLGFGILGGYIFSFYDKADITASVFNTFAIAFGSIMVGVALVGYFHFKNINRLKDFGKALGWGFLGFIAFLIFYIMINALFFKILPHYINSVILPIVMPTLGTVIGLNYIFIRERRK